MGAQRGVIVLPTPATKWGIYQYVNFHAVVGTQVIEEGLITNCEARCRGYYVFPKFNLKITRDFVYDYPPKNAH